MDWTSVQNGPKHRPKGSHEMDTTWEEKKRLTQRDMEKICGKGDERTGMDLGPSASIGQQTDSIGVHW